jgi:hypothetical protein
MMMPFNCSYRNKNENGRIENFVKQVKVHSRCILQHANLPERFWSETTTMYAAVRNIMPNSNKTWSHSHRTQLLSHIGCASTPSCCCTTLAAWLS